MSRSDVENKTAPLSQNRICFLQSTQRTIIKNAINSALLTFADFGTSARRPDLSAVTLFPYYNAVFLLENKHKKLFLGGNVYLSC
jgi:hypothetical protein